MSGVHLLGVERETGYDCSPFDNVAIGNYVLMSTALCVDFNQTAARGLSA